MVRSGVSFKINETFIELWRNSHDDSDEDDDNKTSTTISLYEDDDDDDDLGYSKCCHSTHLHHEMDDDISEEIYDKMRHQETKFAADDGSDEEDSLLVVYDKNSVVSLWHENRTLLWW